MNASLEQRWQRTAAYLAQGQLAPARIQLESLQADAPRDTRTQLLALQLAFSEDRVRDATAHALAAADAVPDDPASLCAVVETLLRVGEVVAARACMAHASLTATSDVRWLMTLADFRQRLDEHVESLALTERAIAAGAAGSRVRFHHGVRLYFNGHLAEAETELEASLHDAPALGRTALALARLRKQTPDNNHLALLATGLESVAKGTRDHAALEFALYKELEDLGRHDDAWRALARGNALMRARRPWDADGQRKYLERLMEACNTDHVAPSDDAREGPQPIFIIGMPRSGTTVLERMLGCHSQVASAGELVDFGKQLHWVADTANTHSERFIARIPELDLADAGRRYLAQTQWRAHGKCFFIDKQPPNWALAGLIHSALPGARILHLVRDPMDVCFSNWRAFFGDTYAYSYDMHALSAYHRDYCRTMAHWHAVMPGAILDVPYDGLVRDPEATLRKVFEFCGLYWEPGCTDMRGNSAPVATLSAAQVRSPLHEQAFGEWRKYESQMAPLQRMLSVA